MMRYWMYDGNWRQIQYWDEQDAEHIISSLEELYDFLIDNLMAHREAKKAEHGKKNL